MTRERPNRFGARLQQARKEAGLSQERFGELLEVAERTVRYYEAGSKEPEMHRLPRIASLTGKPIGWFFDETVRDDAVRVPLYDDVPAGPTRLPLQEVQAMVSVPEHWITGHTQVYCLRVKGTSMQPLLMDGDIIAVRHQVDAESGEIVVATLANGEFVVKRLTRRSGRIVLESLNRDHADLVPSEDLHIDGRVIGVIRDL